VRRAPDWRGAKYQAILAAISSWARRRGNTRAALTVNSPLTKVAQAHLRAGLAALQQGRPRDAADFCRKAIAAAPEHPEAHFLVGLVALDIGDLKTAARAFGSVTMFAPGHAAAYAQLARLFMRMGQPARAEKALAEAKRAGVADAATADLVGVVSSLLGDQKEAKRCYALACAKAPDSDAYAVNFATACIFLGDIDEARTTLERVLARNDRVAQAQWLYSSIVKAASGARAKRLAAAAAGSDAQAAAFLNYAAGKEFEDCEDWDLAFAAFEAGARAKRSLVNYDEASEISMFEALHDLATPGWLDARGPGAADPGPIFVIGQPRTGTTLIESIIASHSMVETAGELQQFGLSVRRLSPDQNADRLSPQSIAQWPSIDPKALGAEYLRATAPMRTGAPRFVDKLPNNFLYAPLILAALPNARVVHLTRDPMDSCFASFKQLFAEAYAHSYDLAEMARHHARYRRLMRRWREIFPGRILDVSYEAVVSGLEGETRRLIDFLGLGWEDACLRFHEQGRAVPTASAVQVRETAHTRSVGRWRRYADHLEPMRRVLADAGVF